MPLVIDCVPYFNEADVWRLRYETLRDVVDGFVVVEGDRTHAGQPKGLAFPYAGDLVGGQRLPGPPVLRWTAGLPDGTDPGIPATRRREMFQRNAIAHAVVHLLYDGHADIRDDTIILISDCDEVPDPRAVAYLREHGLPDGEVWVFGQHLFYYDLNTSAGHVWQGTRAARWADVRAMSPHVIRYGLGQPDAHYPLYRLVRPGGWHLSYFGGAAAVRRKMAAFLHQELVSPEAVAGAEARIAAGVDVWGRADGHQFTRGPALDVPPPVVVDPARWRHLLHPDYQEARDGD